MTQEELKTKLRDILHIPVPLDDNWPFANEGKKIDEVLQLINQHVKQVIGEDATGKEINLDEYILRYPKISIRFIEKVLDGLLTYDHDVKELQRKRAGL